MIWQDDIHRSNIAYTNVCTEHENLTAIPVDHFGRYTGWLTIRYDAEIPQYGCAFMELYQK